MSLKSRLKKKRQKMKKFLVDTGTLDDVKENKEYFQKDIYWDKILIFFAAFLIAFLSAWLRVQGISELFLIPITISSFFVFCFIIAELAISIILLNDTFDLKHKFINFFILGIIQIVLIGLSFVFEFSALSDKLMRNTKTSEYILEKEKFLRENLNDIEKRINLLTNQYNEIDSQRITLKKQYFEQINKLIEEKKEVQDKLTVVLNEEDVKKEKTEGNGIKNSAELLNVSTNTLSKFIAIIIASILNILYLTLIYSGLKMLKRNLKEND